MIKKIFLVFICLFLANTLFAKKTSGSKKMTYEKKAKTLLESSRNANMDSSESKDGLPVELYFPNGHTDMPDVSLSPNGKYLASGTFDERLVHIWNIEQGKEVRTYFGASVLSWSPDGIYAMLIKQGEIGEFQLWDITRNKKINSISCKYPNISNILWTPDGKYVICSFRHENNSVKIYDVHTGQLYKTLDIVWAGSYSWDISPDGKKILIAYSKNGLYEYDLFSGNFIRNLPILYIDTVAYSPDGKYIAAVDCSDILNESGQIIRGCGKQKVKVLNAINGMEIAEIKRPSHEENYEYQKGFNIVKKLLWANEGNILVVQFAGDQSGQSKQTDELYNPFTGKFIKTLLPERFGQSSSNNMLKLQNSTTKSFTPDFTLMAVGYNINYNNRGYIDIFKIKSTSDDIFQLEQYKTLNVEKSYVEAIFSPIGDKFITKSSENSTFIWKSESGTKIKKIASNMIEGRTSWSPNGHFIATNKELFNIDTEEVITKWTSTNLGDIKWSLNSQYVALVTDTYLTLYNYNSNIKVWDVENKRIVQSFDFNNGNINTKVALSPNGSLLAFTDDGSVRIRNVKTNIDVQKINIQDCTSIRNIEWAPNGNRLSCCILTKKGGWEIAILNTDTWQEENRTSLRSYMKKMGDNTIVNEINMSWNPNNNHIAIITDKGGILIYEMKKEDFIKYIPAHATSPSGYQPNSISWSIDGKKLFSNGYGDSIKAWDAETFELLYTIVIQGSDYITYTPEGFFTGSETAKKNLVYPVFSLESIELDQLSETLFRPDLILAKFKGKDISNMGTEAESIASKSSNLLTSIISTGNAPLVKFTNTPHQSTSRDAQITFSVQDQGGGIGAVYLSLNGKVIQLAEGSRKLQLIGAGDIQATPTNGGKTITYAHTVSLQNGENIIEAYAMNSAGKIESRKASTKITWRGATQKPSLYVLSVGVNDYRDRNLRLEYAVPDASAMAESFRVAKGKLYDAVNITTVLNADVTAAGISAAFDAVSQKVSADDVFVLYISGHGMTHTDGDYYFIPVDFRYRNSDSIPQEGISKRFITENLSKIKAQKTLVILDTCNSGSFINASARGMAEKTAIDRLSRATGQATIAASSDQQSAMEGYKGHGVFTYVLLEGLSGKADLNGDGYISVSELASYAEEKVPELSFEKWGYEQFPQVDLRKQSSFPLVGK